jgi:hypothetical protein
MFLAIPVYAMSAVGSLLWYRLTHDVGADAAQQNKSLAVFRPRT